MFVYRRDVTHGYQPNISRKYTRLFIYLFIIIIIIICVVDNKNEVCALLRVIIKFFGG